MKITGVLIVLMFVFSVFCTTVRGYKSLNELSQKTLQIKKRMEANYFISESFRNTCNGKGFDSLNEWQVTCRQMWNLDYIAWADAADFMEVNYTFTDKKLMYGKWNSSLVNGEVYSRRK